MIYKNLFARYILIKATRMIAPTNAMKESTLVFIFLALVVCTSLGSFQFIKATIRS